MRVRRWVVYRFDALPEPDDLVHSEARFFTKRGAKNYMWAHNFPDLHEFMDRHKAGLVDRPVYWQVMHAPGKRFGWRTRRWLYSRSHR